MAEIVENPNGGRRMIRLTSEDILMIVSMVQQEFRGAPTSYAGVQHVLSSHPFYLPEEVF